MSRSARRDHRTLLLRVVSVAPCLRADPV